MGFLLATVMGTVSSFINEENNSSILYSSHGNCAEFSIFNNNYLNVKLYNKATPEDIVYTKTICISSQYSNEIFDMYESLNLCDLHIDTLSRILKSIKEYANSHNLGFFICNNPNKYTPDRKKAVSIEPVMEGLSSLKIHRVKSSKHSDLATVCIRMPISKSNNYSASYINSKLEWFRLLEGGTNEYCKKMLELKVTNIDKYNEYAVILNTIVVKLGNKTYMTTQTVLGDYKIYDVEQDKIIEDTEEYVKLKHSIDSKLSIIGKV